MIEPRAGLVLANADGRVVQLVRQDGTRWIYRLLSGGGPKSPPVNGLGESSMRRPGRWAVLDGSGLLTAPGGQQ